MSWFVDCINKSRGKRRVSPDHSIRSTQVTPEKREKCPFLFVFVGESGSGKSTAISNIFNVPPPPQENNEASADGEENTYNYNALQRWKVEKNGYALDVVEVAGFLQNDSLEQDAGIVTALASFLKKESPERIPSIVFFTAKITDSRFEGEQSTYSRTLKCLLQARSLLTDCNCSNVILLLTHADRPEVKEDMGVRGERYQHAFSNIFKMNGNPKDLSAMAVGNSPLTAEELLTSFKKANLADSDFKLLKKFAQSEILEHGSMAPYNYQNMKVDELITTGGLPKIRRVLSNMLEEASVMKTNFLEVDSDDETENEASSGTQFTKSMVVAVEVLLESAQTSLSLTPVHNCVHPNSGVTLATGRDVAVADLLVGDKVLGVNREVGTITKICKIYKGERKRPPSTTSLSSFACLDCGDHGFTNLCMVYLKALTSVATTGPMGQSDAYLCAYNPLNKTFLPRKYHPDIQKLYLANMKTLAYYLEVDGGFGTFIADGFVRVCKEKAVLKNIPNTKFN